MYGGQGGAGAEQFPSIIIHAEGGSDRMNQNKAGKVLQVIVFKHLELCSLGSRISSLLLSGCLP